MKSTKAASRYAKALLELSIELKKVDEIAADMKYLAEVNEETKDFQLLLGSPVINSDKKIEIFDELFGQFEELTTQFIHLITKKRREYMLAQVAESFAYQLKLHRGIVPITLISAVELDKKTKEKILDKVQDSVKGKLEVTEIIDETIIGGFIVQMNNTQIDASIQSQLTNLKQRLTR